MNACTSVEADRKCTHPASAPRLLGIVTLFACALSTQATGATTSREVIEFAGIKRSFYVYPPDSPAPSAPAPLVMLLHGSGQNGATLLREWTGLAAAEGFVLVAPNALDDLQWQLRSDGPGFLRDVITATAATHRIDPRRIYLFGVSGGAVYALTLSLLESEYFAATAVFAGAWRDDASLAIVPLARRKIPVAIFIGDRDEFFPMKSVKATEAALRQAGHPVAVTILKRQGHSYAAVARNVNRDAWEFLAAIRLESDPIFQPYEQDR